MLSNEDNDRICRVGRDTPMGKVMRKFWVPALMSSELPEESDTPIPVELLGERLVAFRDDDGQVGILDEYCCHRTASLAMGRVEDCGLRCIYHGWLFAANGDVLETPNVADPQFKTRIKQGAYPVRESGGLIWAYLGDDEIPPALPDFPWVNSELKHRVNLISYNHCNWVQMVEGLVDSSHLSILHTTPLTLVQQAQGLPPKFKKGTHMKFDAAPRIETDELADGFQYAALREVNDRQEVRITVFISPFYVLNANEDVYLICVPMSDERTAFYNISYDGTTEYNGELSGPITKIAGYCSEDLAACGLSRDTFWENIPTHKNRWFQDREAMRDGHFTGLTGGITQEDAMVSVSSGAIRDRSNEHLSISDSAIAMLYRTLLKNAALVEECKDPIGLNRSVAGYASVSEDIDLEADWRELACHNLKVNADT